MPSPATPASGRRRLRVRRDTAQHPRWTRPPAPATRPRHLALPRRAHSHLRRGPAAPTMTRPPPPAAGRPPLQRCQRIRTRVDDRHPMPFNSEGYGESTGPTTKIDDVQPSTRINPRPPCQRHPQSLTHQRGPQTPPPPIHHQPSSHSPEPPHRATPYFHPTPTTDLAAHRDQRRQPPHAGPERPAGRTTDHPPRPAAPTSQHD